MRTYELTGSALDWAVAQAESNVRLQYDSREGLVISNVLGWIPYRPSLAWQQGGPIIERCRIDINYNSGAGSWTAYVEGTGWPKLVEKTGPTPLIAAMRCYVASELGDEVDVPDELL